MKKLTFALFVILVLALLWGTHSPAYSAVGNFSSTLPESTLTLLQELDQNIAAARKSAVEELGSFPVKIEDIQKRLAELQGMADIPSSDLGSAITQPQIEARALVISNLLTAYGNYESLIRSVQVRQKDLSTMTSPDEVSSVNPLKQPPPYSMVLYDTHRRSYEKQKQVLEMQLFLMRTDLNNLDVALTDLRKDKQSLESVRVNSGTESIGSWDKILLELNAELSKAKLANAVQRAVESQLKKEKDLQTLELEVRQLNWIRKNLVFPESDLKQNIADLQQRIDTQRQLLPAIKDKLNEATVSYNKARALLSDDVTDLAVLTPVATQYIERQANLDYWEYSLSIIQDELGWLSAAQQIWNVRYGLFHNKLKGDEIWKNRNQAQSNITELKASLENVQSLQTDTYTRLSTVKKQIEDANGKSRQNLVLLSQTLQNMLSNVLNRYTYLIPEQLLLQQMLYEEASAKIDTLRLAEQVGTFSKETLLSFMNTVLWSGEDYTVTISKLVYAVMIFISSFFLSNRGSRWIQRTVLKKFSSDITAANATQRILFYILWFSFFLIALQMVRIPLTAFAFLGGAMVLAIGFGAQNLFNNLISGFIIMFSRPFQVDDIVEIDNVTGTVEEIGSRSTRIKTWDNFDVILPNRYLLENKVVNWSGGDKKMRDRLVLEVRHDSDSRKVEELLLKMAKDHSKVLKDPAPFVLFGNFAESSLTFTLFFWVDLDQASSAKVASDMRHHLLYQLRAEGIDLPFPQMDVHLQPAASAAEHSA